MLRRASQRHAVVLDLQWAWRGQQAAVAPAEAVIPDAQRETRRETPTKLIALLTPAPYMDWHEDARLTFGHNPISE